MWSDNAAARKDFADAIKAFRGCQAIVRKGAWKGCDGELGPEYGAARFPGASQFAVHPERPAIRNQATLRDVKIFARTSV